MKIRPRFKTPIKIVGPSWRDDRKDTQVDLANKVEIESLYSGKLRKVGRVLMGLCPFHEERTPSFAIYPEGNTWHCFACGIGGDALSFYMKQTGVSFIKAVEDLNDR